MGLSPFECYDVLSEEYPGEELPTLDCIRAVYEGFEDCIAVSRVYPHIYGKTLTKPYRKMGHITITDSDRDQAKAKAKSIKSKIRVIAK